MTIEQYLDALSNTKGVGIILGEEVPANAPKFASHLDESRITPEDMATIFREVDGLDWSAEDIRLLYRNHGGELGKSLTAMEKDGSYIHFWI